MVKEITSDLDPEMSNGGIFKLKQHLEGGISLLSSITSTSREFHPLIISQQERNYRKSNRTNEHHPFSTNSVRLFHRTAMNLKQIKALEKQIDKWAGDCIYDLERINPEGLNNDQFTTIRLKQNIALDKPNNFLINDRILAELQIRLKVELENMLLYLIRRIAYFEVFGQYPKIMAIELLIETYTRRFIEVLIGERLFDWIEIYPDFYDPLFVLLPYEQFSNLTKGQITDTRFIIDSVRQQMANPLRERFSWSISEIIIDGTERSKNICDRILIVMEGFERELEISNWKKLPGRFKKQWDKELIAIEQIFDLITAINRLPIYLRDEMPPLNTANPKRESKSKGKCPTFPRNKQMCRDYKELLSKKSKENYEGLKFGQLSAPQRRLIHSSAVVALKKRYKQYNLSLRTIEDIIRNSKYN
jgi:hypothetical protein